MVGFRDLVGTCIAPVSNKTAVKRQSINHKCNWIVLISHTDFEKDQNDLKSFTNANKGFCAGCICKKGWGY